MDFTLTEEQEALRGLAEQILRDLTTTQRLGSIDGWFDRQAWQALADAGLLGVALPPADGGSGLGFLGAHLVLEQVGRTAAPVPFWETIVLGALPIAAFGSEQQRREILPRVLAGDLLLTAALTEDGADDLAAPRTRATRTSSGWELHGAKTSVPIAPLADMILIPATADEAGVGVWLVASDAAGVRIEPQEVVSGQPFGEVTLDRVAVAPDGHLGGDEVLAWLLAHGAAGLASTLSGVCAAVVRLSADYTSSREQFGRPVATFQAVAQRVAEAYIDAEAVELTALQAAWRLGEGLPAAEEVAIAKWWAAEAGHRVLHAAHHVHGGVGVDREYPLHRYFGIAKQAEFLLGGAPAQLLRIGAVLAAEPV